MNVQHFICSNTIINNSLRGKSILYKKESFVVENCCLLNSLHSACLKKLPNINRSGFWLHALWKTRNCRLLNKHVHKGGKGFYTSVNIRMKERETPNEKKNLILRFCLLLLKLFRLILIYYGNIHDKTS